MRVARLTLNARVEPDHRPRLGVLGVLGALQREQRAEDVVTLTLTLTRTLTLTLTLALTLTLTLTCNGSNAPRTCVQWKCTT